MNDERSGTTMLLPLFDKIQVIQMARPMRFEAPSVQRTLKVEATGDFWKGRVKPKIRLVGKWLERAGFSAGNKVAVMCVAPGIIELRAIDRVNLPENKKRSQSGPDC